MSRILAVLMIASLTMVACDGNSVQSVSSPTATAQPASPATNNAGLAIGGIVQSIDKPTRIVNGALIEVIEGPNTGKSVVSDNTGSFAIFGLTAGPAKIRVTGSGFQAWTSKDFDFQSDVKIAVELFPTPPTNASGATATGRCNDGGWTWSSSRADACVNNSGLAYGVCPGPFCKSAN
jgi:hypothetical protein